LSRVAVCTLLLECPSHEIIVRRGTFCCGSWITSDVTQSYWTSWTMSLGSIKQFFWNYVTCQ